MVEDRAAEGPDPEQSALAGDRRRQVAAALAALPAEAREILVLREIEDLSYKQIAAVLDLPVGTVMSRLARAREKLAAELRGRLGRRGMDCPTCEAMVDAYVDGELSATESIAFERALAGCPTAGAGSRRRGR